MVCEFIGKIIIIVHEVKWPIDTSYDVELMDLIVMCGSVENHLRKKEDVTI